MTNLTLLNCLSFSPSQLFGQVDIQAQDGGGCHDLDD
jgi:hypothetical protein